MLQDVIQLLCYLLNMLPKSRLKSDGYPTGIIECKKLSAMSGSEDVIDGVKKKIKKIKLHFV